MIELDNPFAKAHKATEIINFLPMHKGTKILDIGCGPGRVLLPLAQKAANLNGNVTGLDIQHEMLKKCETKAQSLGINNIDLVLGNIENVPLRQKYDVILMICVLGEITDANQHSTIRKALDHLKPKGIISITETIFDPHFQRRQKVIELMGEAGLAETNFTGNSLAYTSHFQKKT